MPEEYGSHRDYMDRVGDLARARLLEVEAALHKAFDSHIESRQVEVIVFADMSASELAQAIAANPLVLKPLLTVCNIAGRAIERDLQIRNLDTYKPRLTLANAQIVAGYVKPFLPHFVEIPTLCQLDRVSFIDKEIRKGKGRWEKTVLAAMNRFSRIAFRKRKFESAGEWFELDLAAPAEGPIQVGVDVKRIEARRDIHKRCDEIVNKAAKFKLAMPGGKFGAILYYPFVTEQVNVENRLRSDQIDAIVFAGESEDSIESAVRMLLAILRLQA